MIKIKFYEITENEFELKIKPDETNSEDNPVFIIYIDNPNAECITISNEVIKEKLLKDKKSGYYYVEVTDDDNKKTKYAVTLLNDKESLIIYFYKENENMNNSIEIEKKNGGETVEKICENCIKK